MFDTKEQRAAAYTLAMAMPEHLSREDGERWVVIEDYSDRAEWNGERDRVHVRYRRESDGLVMCMSAPQEWNRPNRVSFRDLPPDDKRPGCYSMAGASGTAAVTREPKAVARAMLKIANNGGVIRKAEADRINAEWEERINAAETWRGAVLKAMGPGAMRQKGHGRADSMHCPNLSILLRYAEPGGELSFKLPRDTAKATEMVEKIMEMLK